LCNVINEQPLNVHIELKQISVVLSLNPQEKYEFTKLIKRVSKRHLLIKFSQHRKFTFLEKLKATTSTHKVDNLKKKLNRWATYVIAF